MKIVFTVTENKAWDSPVDPRFGRAAGFLFYDSETDAFTWHDNTANVNAAHGAGTQASQTVLQHGADVLITGNVGPKASAVLSSGGIRVITGAAGKTVRRAYDEFTVDKGGTA